MTIGELMDYIEENLQDGCLTKDSPVIFHDGWDDSCPVNELRNDGGQLILSEVSFN